MLPIGASVKLGAYGTCFKVAISHDIIFYFIYKISVYLYFKSIGKLLDNNIKSDCCSGLQYLCH